MGELLIPQGAIPSPKDDPGFYPAGLDSDVSAAVKRCVVQIDVESATSDVTFPEEVLERLDSYNPKKVAQLVGHTILNVHGLEKERHDQKYASIILALTVLAGLYQQPPTPEERSIPKPRDPFTPAPTQPLSRGQGHARRIGTKLF